MTDTARATAWSDLDAVQQLRSLVESAPLALVVEEPDGRICAWSAAAERIFGWTCDQALGRCSPRLVVRHPDEARARTARALAGEQVIDVEVECLRGDGSMFMASVSSSRLSDGAGHPLGVVSVYADLSDRRRAERQLALQMELLRILMECESADEASWRAIAAFCELLKWSCGARWSLDAASGRVRCLETWHAPGDAASAAFMAEIQQSSAALEQTDALLRRVWNQPTASYERSLTAQSGPIGAGARLAGLDSALALPVHANGEVYSVIGLFGRGPLAAEADTLVLAEQFGGQLGQFMARRDAERTLHFVASHDALTGLPNRVMFAQRLGQALAQAARYARQAAVLFVDLDRFKFVNDTMGHEVGDRLLTEAAERMRESLREGDTVGRHGGDEFVVLIDQYDSAAQVAGVAQKIIDRIARPYEFDGQELNISASIGIATFPSDGRDGQTLMKHADIAMYRAKQAGKNQYQFYSSHMNRRSLDRLEMESALTHALENSELELHYQPTVDLKGRRVTALEALLRWRRAHKGLVLPGEFLPQAEESWIAVAIGDWVLKHACAQARQWQQARTEATRVSVNVSARHFAHGRLVASVEAALSGSGLAPQLLELDVTEAVLLQDPARAEQILRDLKRLGVRIALDDFGTGYSALTHLRRYPIDAVKVDRSFISGIAADAGATDIARAVIAMAHGMRILAIAEGVETEEQARFLRIHACDEMQGNYFGTALPAAHATERLVQPLRPGRRLGRS